jgi:hypothetical protein
MSSRQLYHPLITATDSDRELAFQQLSLNGKPADLSEGPRPTDQRKRGLSTNCMELSPHRPTAANAHSESTLGYWSVPADPFGARAQNFHAETAGIFVFRRCIALGRKVVSRKCYCSTLLSNYGSIMFKRFVSQITHNLYN